MENIRFVKVDTPQIYRILGLKMVFSENLFTPKQIKEIHCRRVDYQYTFAKPKFTRDTCKFSIFEQKDSCEKFLKFGCLLFLDSANFLRMSKDDFEDFVEKLRVKFLECHFFKHDTYDLVEAYKDAYYDIRNNLIASKEGREFLYKINKEA